LKLQWHTAVHADPVIPKGPDRPDLIGLSLHVGCSVHTYSNDATSSFVNYLSMQRIQRFQKIASGITMQSLALRQMSLRWHYVRYSHAQAYKALTSAAIPYYSLLTFYTCSTSLVL
jgi:hypothetical protein